MVDSYWLLHSDPQLTLYALKQFYYAGKKLHVTKLTWNPSEIFIFTLFFTY